MVPLGTLVNVREIGGPISVTRYNLYTAAADHRQRAPRRQHRRRHRDHRPPGRRDAAAVHEDGVDRADVHADPRGQHARCTSSLLAVVCVFLALAALYESWSLPLAVILVVPLCLLCSVAGVLFTHRDVNIFVQIGLVVLVGLACKNAILIVEFAKQLHQEGRPRFEATLEASRLRLRPILMTSFAFILGVVPLVVAVGGRGGDAPVAGDRRCSAACSA